MEVLPVEWALVADSDPTRHLSEQLVAPVLELSRGLQLRLVRWWLLEVPDNDPGDGA